MAPTPAPSLPSLLEATLVLSDQFISSLSLPTQPQSEPPSDSTTPLPLPLLTTSATALKAQTTKLSLLSINTPFTPSALTTVLTTVNDSILPSLVTAALLTLPASYTTAFHAEAKLLVKDVLREFGGLVGVVRGIAREQSGGDGKGNGIGEEVKVRGEQKKEMVLGATGRVWKACDELVTFAGEGVVGLVVRKARMYFELVRDGMRELEDWDPEEEAGDDEDDGFFDDDEDEDENGLGKEKNENEEKPQPTPELLHSQKSHMLRLLTPLAQIYPAIISQRLKKTSSSSTLTPSTPLCPSSVSQLDRLLPHLRELPNLLDEAAGSLYEHDLDNAAEYTTRLRKTAFMAAEVMRVPLSGGSSGAAGAKEGEGEQGGKNGEEENVVEDKFPKWADTWKKVVEEIAKSKMEG
ncbi:hypothetical protein FQN50_008942 [Emmonsiellopsis sp. PD_5]|nr:hypothetical protein FQN50_008942 [Emmonsiellopsis sp. PD_5]